MSDLRIRYAVLRDHRTWPDAACAGLDMEADGVLALSRLPDSAPTSTIIVLSPYETTLSGIGVGRGGDVYVARTEDDSLIGVMRDCVENRRVVGNGGRGALGGLDKPRGLAVGSKGLYVADSGHARVLVFRVPGLELRDIWEGGLTEPVAVAVDGQERIYVLDRPARVLRFDPAGIPDPAYAAAVAQSGLQSPAAIAVDGNGALHVSDDQRDRILRFDSVGKALAEIGPAGGPTKPRALVAHADRLYVADAATGRIWVHQHDQGWLGTLPGYRGPVSAMAVDDRGRLYLKPGLDDRYHVLEPGGACVSRGHLTAGPFDAGEGGCWERVQVQAEAIEAGGAELRIFCVDSANPPTEADWSTDATRAPALDMLVPPPRLGEPQPRYLWLRVTLWSDDAHASPRLVQVQAATTADSYLDHLPPVYARTDALTGFLARWLALFRAELGDWERALEETPRRFDARTAAEGTLEPLAAWLAFELPERADVDARRTLIPAIHRLHERRGTPSGLRELCALHTGVRPHIFEAFTERHVWQLAGSADGHEDLPSRLGFDTALADSAPDGMVVAGMIRPDPAYAGLLGDYYGDAELRELKHTQIDATVDFRWDGASRPPRVAGPGFSVRWTGQLKPRHSEVHTFSATASGEVRLWIDGRLIVDGGGSVVADGGDGDTVVEHSGRIALQAERWYAITLELRATSSSAAVALRWASRSQARELVPRDRLYALLDEGARSGGGASSATGETMLVGQTVVGASGPLAAADYGAPLFEDDAHLFTVLLPADALPNLAARQRLRQLVEAEKPAHTDFHLCFVEPRMRVGFQARVGIDAFVAGPPPPMSMAGTVLGQTSYLGDGEDGAAVGRVGSHARLGHDTIVG